MTFAVRARKKRGEPVAANAGDQAAASSHAPGPGKHRRAAQRSGKARRGNQAARSLDVAAALLEWYDRDRRDLPWRSAPGQAANPYAVWLSEVMLQQTTVKAVAPYFAQFLMRWPTVQDLAAAREDDVLAAWAGLGYYSRARNLHRCAQVVCETHDGVFPSDEAELRKLPGIGPYTAAAISAIAFQRPATPVDGNIERVTARLFNIDTPLPQAKPRLKAAASTLTPDQRPGDFAQAMMDLGATICTPRRPSCLMCPLQALCQAHAEGVAETLPRRSQKPERPTRVGAAFVALSDDGQVLLRQRPATGLLARMSEVPGTDWSEGGFPADDDALKIAPVKAAWWKVPGCVVHTFTHFRLELVVFRALVPAGAPLTIWADGTRCRWVSRRDLDEAALPSVMKKVIGHALAHI